MVRMDWIYSGESLTVNNRLPSEFFLIALKFIDFGMLSHIIATFFLTLGVLPAVSFC